ncbi:DUF4956 domain-containing protein [Ilumatobacter coccineus]|jgi:Domain of unknown function (DUF4956)|uniref:DUF4956 domain-containing protein n=1 Tax=Ilumatobacter coccineus (strain NBRC 103263 / KCTC 29153 / YM16-304) TaxID=1313172 RepID=A0A6C7E6J0_ILUCY|nr:DUF4956 domain-containing protein [Ilumatobacter coccineus]BAN00869.1 hypothetical protein YM304_05550 [Ilumatobacter coccineus YM16-304]
MSSAALVTADLVAITLLVFGLYFPRYRRRDMVVAILGLNVGVMAVATALATAEVSAGLGLGLFGVLSIIRLRSSELSQDEIAYYFTALAIGLLGGVKVSPAWVTPVLMGAILVILFVADHPRLFTNHRHQTITLDTAYPDESVAVAHLESLLGAEVTRLRVKKLDLVHDTTVVDVCFKLRRDQGSGDIPSGHPEFADTSLGL